MACDDNDWHDGNDEQKWAIAWLGYLYRADPISFYKLYIDLEFLSIPEWFMVYKGGLKENENLLAVKVQQVAISHAYTYPPLPRVPLSYQAIACSLSTLHFLKYPENSFEVLKLLKNSVRVLKILKNKLESMKILKNKVESMKILENKLESLKPQENQPVDGLVPLFIKNFYIRKCLREAVKE
nr:hypothetical protein [Tanacetum cinerariifolium]